VFVAIGLVVCLRAVVVAFGLVINESSRSRTKKKKKKNRDINVVISYCFPLSRVSYQESNVPRNGYLREDAVQGKKLRKLIGILNNFTVQIASNMDYKCVFVGA